jgi:hypothetical protein
MDRLKNLDRQEACTQTPNLGSIPPEDYPAYKIVPNLVDKFKVHFGGHIPPILNSFIIRQVNDVDNEQAAEVIEKAQLILEEVLAEYRQSKLVAIEGGKAEDGNTE